MRDELEPLVTAVLKQEPGAASALLKALERDVPAILELLESDEGAVRRVAVRAAAGRDEPELLEALEGALEDSHQGVRHALAQALLDHAPWGPDAWRLRLLDDDAEDIRLLAVRSTQGRRSFHDRLVRCLEEEWDWNVRRAAAKALGETVSAALLPVYLTRLAEDDDRDVARACAELAEKVLDPELEEDVAALEPPRISVLEKALSHLNQLGGADRWPGLVAWIEERSREGIDPDWLARFGVDLTAPEAEGRLPRAYGVERVITGLREILTAEAPRAALLLGASGVGKSAVVYELARRMAPEGWHFLRVTPSELLVGTMYLGEWQTKLKELVQAIRWPRKVVLYVPGVHELTELGRTTSTDATLATMLGPEIESGAVTILGETTPELFGASLSRAVSFRRLFTTVDHPEATPAETREILGRVAEDADCRCGPEDLDHLAELADFHLAGTAQPGRAVGLLRRVLETVPDPKEGFGVQDVLGVLSSSTGLPLDLLDDRRPLDLARVRAFFEERVMGQPEATDAVVDLVTLIKAGLTDPEKPFGVVLFVGPTGVGKTQMARSLAELVFGDPGRLIRFDMSEFATYDAFERLIGRGREPGLLTEAVRTKPLAVILLDEIEKAHVNVFDLCLQIFDAGRLTDAQGRVADFRRSVLVLTSNLGASVAAEDGVGFGGGPPPAPAREDVLREVDRFFRPEFLNRLDRTVVFRPLSEETAERITRREVATVIRRSGIARRHLLVDVDPSVIALLLRRGYSLSFGARHLKRTVERELLLPLARRIATGPVEASSVLRVGVRGGSVEVRVVPPEGSEGETVAAPDFVAPRARVEELRDRVRELPDRAAPIRDRRADLLRRSRDPSFWQDPAKARSVLDVAHRLDAILDDLERLRRRVKGFRPEEGVPALRVEPTLLELEHEAARLDWILSRADDRELGDALVVLSLVRAEGPGLDGVGRLAGMYAGLARRRRLELQVLIDRRGGVPEEDTIALLLAGAGAHALLAGESGLHHLIRTVKSRRTGDPREQRDVVRVDVLPAPPEDAWPPAEELRCEARPLRGVEGRLIAHPRHELSLLHVPTMTGVQAWVETAVEKAKEALLPLLAARIARARDGAPASDASVRRYVLGPTPLVRDRRTGRSTGRLQPVLDGEIDFLLADADPGPAHR
jgi:ATP-dependent Clp protease ATP-binding subunit ClpC